MLLGNDVVDLHGPGNRRKSGSTRFVRRVFTEAEAARIHAAPDPDVVLWLYWSAKEAAFKIARKLDAGVLFAHRRFEVVPDSDHDGRPSRATGRVLLHEGLGLGLEDVRIEWRSAPTYVHCLATQRIEHAAELRVRVASLEECGVLGTALSVRERECVRTQSSERVRRLTKELAQEMGLGDVEIVRERSGDRLGPPRLHRSGAAAPLEGWDISLSHDGRFVAAALARSG
ncbi:MAG: 4'-phosphopantetheinyl transferase superfamily protein [Gemmatimonadota bacterium]